MDFPVQSRNQPGPNFPTCLGCQPPMANGKIRTIQSIHPWKLEVMQCIILGHPDFLKNIFRQVQETPSETVIKKLNWAVPLPNQGSIQLLFNWGQHMQPGLARKYLTGARHKQLHKSWSSQVLRSNGLLALSKLSMAPFTVPWMQKLSGSLTSGPQKYKSSRLRTTTLGLITGSAALELCHSESLCTYFLYMYRCETVFCCHISWKLRIHHNIHEDTHELIYNFQILHTVLLLLQPKSSNNTKQGVNACTCRILSCYTFAYG